MAEKTKVHLSANPTVSRQWDRITASFRFEGDYDELSGLMNGGGYEVGLEYVTLAGAKFPLDESRISSVSVGRTSGSRGYMQLEIVGLTKKYMVQLSMNEVSKNIRTWNADAEQETNRPNLQKLAEWELWKEKGDQASLSKYNEYLDKDGVKLTGNTLKLAQMIFRGVAEYAAYQPSLVYTFTAYEMTSDMGAHMGKKVEKDKLDPVGYSVLGVSGATTSEYQALKPYFIKTGLSSSLNPDGTYTFNVTYMGVDSYEKDIYEEK